MSVSANDSLYSKLRRGDRERGNLALVLVPRYVLQDSLRPLSAMVVKTKIGDRARRTCSNCSIRPTLVFFSSLNRCRLAYLGHQNVILHPGLSFCLLNPLGLRMLDLYHSDANEDSREEMALAEQASI
jgi:hypothetical protein